MRKMGKSGKSGLMGALDSHTRNIYETLKMFDETAAASLERTDWKEVIKLGEEIAKQATVAGILWTGEAPKVTELEESMGVYFNMLNGLLLLCHGSTVGAGPTLHASICASTKQMIESSLSFLRAAVLSYENPSSGQRQTIPTLVGLVWESCQALKTTPTNNPTAIGRKIIQVAASVKDVLREMKELKPADETRANQTGEDHDTRPDAEAEATVDDDEGESSTASDIGSNLSPQEMVIAASVILVASDTLQYIKELLRFVTALSKKPDVANSTSVVVSLENLLQICEKIGVQIDELGASVYPPQETSLMNTAVRKLVECIERTRAEVQSFDTMPEGLSQVCQALENSLNKLESDLGCLDQERVPEIHKLHLNT
ncbi:uncharacterized protein LOC116263758 [Nymphaea colorata]|nr:uncharacterized protein LOC116263758 [Nymphaea colorata]